jgi:hypothetical protein
MSWSFSFDAASQTFAVRFWHLADMRELPINVRFLGVKRTALGLLGWRRKQKAQPSA